MGRGGGGREERVGSGSFTRRRSWPRVSVRNDLLQLCGGVTGRRFCMIQIRATQNYHFYLFLVSGFRIIVGWYLIVGLFTLCSVQLMGWGVGQLIVDNNTL